MGFPVELDKDYLRIYAGVAWPAGRPGFLVVVGQHRLQNIAGEPKLIVLDQLSEARVWDLLQRCAAMRDYYRPERFYADRNHLAAMQLIADHHPQLAITHALLCEMPGPCAYAFPLLARWIETGRLVIGGELAGEMLTAPVHQDPADLALADYPAIAALAFAVLGLESIRREPGGPRQQEALW